MKVTITKISRFTTDKDGKPLMTKDNHPYTRLRLQTNEQGAEWLSGFGNADNAQWAEGDTVEIEVKQVGQYLNFSTPKQADVLEAKFAELEKRVTALENKDEIPF